MQHFVFDSAEKVTFQMFWEDVIPGSLTIAASVWSAPAELTIDDEMIDGKYTSVLVSAGTGFATGRTYVVQNTVTASNGEVFNDSVFLLTEDK